MERAYEKLSCTEKALIDFLQSHNGIKTTDEQKQLPYLSYSVITVNTSDLVRILNGLEKLVMPTHEDRHTVMIY